MLKVIFHVSDLDRWKPVVSNIRNLLKEMGEQPITIEVCANSQAARNYIEASKQQLHTMEELSEKVDFVVCRNSLKALDLADESLPSFVRVVPAGVLELIQKQQEGYAYLKP